MTPGDFAMPNRRLVCFAPSIAVACSVFASVALGDPVTADDALVLARQAFRDGVVAEDAGRYEEALGRYAVARESASSPALLFNMATCREKLGRWVEATKDYESARELARARRESDVERESAARLEALAKEMPHLVIRVPLEAGHSSVEVDGRAVPPADVERLAVDPGVHHLVVRAEFLPSTDLLVELAPQSERVIDVSVASPVPTIPSPEVSPGPETRAATRTPHPAPPPASYVPAALCGAVAFGLAGGAVGTGVAASNLRSQYLALNAIPAQANVGEREHLRAAGTALQETSAILTGTAVAMAAVGLVLVLLPPRVGRAKASAGWLLPGGSMTSQEEAAIGVAF